nr:hypothetical protein [uncultured Desulfuromonas sp.]
MTSKLKWTVYLSAICLLLPVTVFANPLPQQDPGGKHCVVTQKKNCSQSRRPLGDEALWWQNGNKTFKKHCMNCHHRNNDVGAKFLHVEARTQQGWDILFSERKVECAQDGTWGSLTEKELQDINDYLYRYAYGTLGVYEARMG